MVGSIQALNPLRLISSGRRIPINPLTILFGLTIAGLTLYTIYSLRNRTTPKAATPFEEGNAAFIKRNFPLAISKYTAALRQTREPNERAKISIRCSRAYINLRQYNQAIDCCNAAYNDDLDSIVKASLVCEMGFAWEMEESLGSALGAYQEAQKIFRSINDDSNTMRVMTSISQIFRKIRDYEASLKSCDEALQLSTNPQLISMVYYSRSWTLLDQDHIAEAEQEIRIALEKALPLDLDIHAQFLILLADILNRKGEPQKALEAGNQAMKLSPNPNLVIEIHLGRALSHYKFNKSMPLDHSLQNYEDALALAKNNAVLRAFILYNKAIVHTKLGQMHSVQNCLEEAAKCDYKNQPFGRDLLRFMLEPLTKEEETFLPAQILEQRIQQKQREFDALVAQEKENS